MGKIYTKDVYKDMYGEYSYTFKELRSMIYRLNDEKELISAQCFIDYLWDIINIFNWESFDKTVTNAQRELVWGQISKLNLYGEENRWSKN